MSQVDEVTLLHRAVSGLVFRPHTGIPVDSAKLNELGLVYARLDANGVTGFLVEAASAISEWATIMHKQTERNRRGVEFISLRTELANSLFKFLSSDIQTLTKDTVLAINNEIDAWLTRQAAHRVHFVPCTIIPYEADSFEIGPVRFIHASKLGEELSQKDPIAELRGDTFLRALQEAYGSWVAVVAVHGAEEKKSSELADLATDIAITGLHIVLPQDVSQRMARINGRIWPAWSCRLFKLDDVEYQNVNNSQPGRQMLPPILDHFLKENKGILDSVGRRITNFLNLNSPFIGLERSWCDAAYWFHEALAEPLDTIAMAKLETTIEILLSAGSSRNSTARIRKAFSVFLGLNSGDLLSKEAQVTVNDFSKAIVEARSRVLHGTWSTLTNEMLVSRSDVTVLAWQFVMRFTTYLDEYLDSSPTDTNNVDLFLDWISLKRQLAKP